MPVLYKSAAGFVEVPYGATIENAGVKHPWQIVSLWSAAELAAIGVYQVDAPVLPDGKTADGGAWAEDADGGPIYEWVNLRDEPIDLLAYAINKRWEVETGGIVVNGMPIQTDDRSKLLISGARQRAEADPNVTEDWYGEITLTAAQVIAISDAVGAHVSNCFKTYGAIKAELNAGTITTTAEIDAAFAA